MGYRGSVAVNLNHNHHRHPAAVSHAISLAWRPYRWRAYATGIVAGVLSGGVIAPLVTTPLVILIYYSGLAIPSDVPWAEILWTVAFGLVAPAAGAGAFVRWQPQRLKAAAQTYVWLAMRAEANWARAFGNQPIPSGESEVRALLAGIPETPQTSGERFGLWISVLDLDRARAAIAQMNEVSADDRFNKASAQWLVDFVAGTTHPIEPLQALADAIDGPEERLESIVTVAVNRARIAASEGHDWQAPLADIRARLGDAPESQYRALLWGPTFRILLITSVVGVVVFWVAKLGFGVKL